MKKICVKVALWTVFTVNLSGAVYNPTTQAQFDTALTSSQASIENNTIDAIVPGGVGVNSPRSFSGNSPNTLNVNINGVAPSGSTPFSINAPLTVNDQGTISLQPSTTLVTMEINNSLTQSGGLVSANSGSSIAITGNYQFDGGILQLGGTNSLQTSDGGTFNIGGVQQTIQVIDSDLSLNLPINLTALAQNLSIDTNGFNASLSNTVTTPDGFSSFPKVNKTGLGNLNFSNLTMTGGGEIHFIDGTTSVEGISQIPYFDLGSGSGANATANFSDPSMVLTVKTFPGNENAAIQVGDFGGIGTLNQTAGTINLYNASLNVSNQGGAGVYNLSGGTINAYGGLYNIGKNSGNNPQTTGIFNLSGNGLFNVTTTSSYLILGSRTNANLGCSNGIFNQTGGTFRVSSGAGFYLSSFGNGIYNLTGGVFQIGNSSLSTNYSAGSGTYQFNFGNGTIQIIESNFSTNANITLLGNQDGTIDTNGFNGDLYGVLSGTGSLTKINNGTLVFHNNNNYSGTTTVNGGILQAGIPNAFSPFSSVILSDSPGVILDLNNNSQTIGSLAGGGPLGGVVKIESATLTVGFDNSNTTFSGLITGAGSLVKIGSGTLNLLGPNDYTGGTQVNEGVLEGNSTSLQGSIVLINDSQLTFNQITDGTFTGSINGSSSSTINKIGPAALQMVTNNSGFNGLTNVTEGNFILNSVLGGLMEVNQKGTISGLGQVLGNLNVEQGGTFAPGIGTFNIGGDLNVGPAGVVQVGINNLGQNSFINVTGNANLTGELQVFTGSNVDKSRTYDLIHYNSISSQFTSVISSNPVLVPLLTYKGNDLLLNFGVDLALMAITKNQYAVAEQLNIIKNPTPAQELIINELVTLASNPQTLPLALKGLNELEGQQYTNRLLSAEMSISQFNSRLYDAMRPIITSIPTCIPETCCNWNVFVEGGGGNACFKGNDEAKGFEMDSYTANLGIQGNINQCWSVGVVGSYEKQKLDFDLTGNSSSNNGLFGFYSVYRPNCYYIFANVIGGYGKQSYTRPITIGNLTYLAKSKPNVKQGAVYLEGGIDLPFDGFLVQPFASLEYEQIWLGSFSESGAYPISLNIRKKNYTGFLGNLGVHATLKSSSITASLDLSWQGRFTPFRNNIHIQFQTFGNGCKIIGAPLSRNSLNGAFTVMVNCGLVNFILQADGQVWSQSSLYNIIGGIQICW